MTVVLFWDIDGTLLTTKRAGIFAWEDAVREVVGERISLQAMPTAGKTDVEIAREIARDRGLDPKPELVLRLLRAYEAGLPSSLSLRAGHPLPGIVDLLEFLRGQEDIHSLLLTGNTAAAATVKLRHYGLDTYFRGGAFAEDGDDRIAVGRQAVRYAERMHGGRVGQYYVIGDTPHDVACGDAIGARAITVATGPYTRAELLRHHPWWALEQVPDPITFLTAVRSAEPPS